MFKKSGSSAISQHFKMVLIFTAVTLPFIVLSFFLASVSVKSAAGEEGPVRIAQAAAPDSDAAAKPHPISALARAKKDASQQLLTRPRVGYDASVLRSLKEMGLVADHIDAWISQHPQTTLKHVKYMSAEMQKNVASTAAFIRKSNAKIDEKTAWREAAALVHYSAKYGVPYALTTAVAHVESTFNPDAVSPKGASGVMQVMWRVHNGLLQSNGIHPEPGKNPLADPEKAIAAGCLLLSRYIRAYGSVQTAMERYYGGKSDTYQRKVTRNIARIMNHRAQLPE